MFGFNTWLSLGCWTLFILCATADGIEGPLGAVGVSEGGAVYVGVNHNSFGQAGVPAVASYSADGTPNWTFSLEGGKAEQSRITNIVATQDGNIVVAGLAIDKTTSAFVTVLNAKGEKQHSVRLPLSGNDIAEMSMGVDKKGNVWLVASRNLKNSANNELFIQKLTPELKAPKDFKTITKKYPAKLKEKVNGLNYSPTSITFDDKGNLQVGLARQSLGLTQFRGAWSLSPDGKTFKKLGGLKDVEAPISGVINSDGGFELAKGSGKIHSGAVSPDGKYLYMISKTNRSKLAVVRYDLAAKKLDRSFSPQVIPGLSEVPGRMTHPQVHLSFTPDGKLQIVGRETADNSNLLIVKLDPADPGKAIPPSLVRNVLRGTENCTVSVSQLK